MTLIHPPKDFYKWAVICEHLIAHLNEGWADGHHYGIEYFEIWNEPDLYGKCWLGTPEEFYELYCITAKHLKEKFPSLKIGGPALTGYREDWMRPFFECVKRENAPMDFYSWHRYAKNVSQVTDSVRQNRALLDEYGFNEVESILNEWNYVKGWGGQDWIDTIETEISLKGAAFIAAVMSACQNEPVDMLMYYDARPCAMNGMFSMYTYKTLKGYYPIKTWGELARMGDACEVVCDIPDIYVTAAKNGAERAVMITYYSDDDSAPTKTFTVDLGDDSEVTVYRLDGGHDMEACEKLSPDGGKITLCMDVNTVVVLK